ncbi:Golgi-specific brefeldin A-resistance guanine nucleotide exchange factor 1-like [Physella acuta]|uniref:Golgi-specific brefeldin A-resistance guanine nucleotide exchange factor 1-like n=1 Tax=Physella acuta TaxID=109671 RepID=UPI0027DBD13B|nr:Golgi-specific brefeldin A-resistance guanine nucleotide exchange factor 1-like [Physella acuta]
MALALTNGIYIVQGEIALLITAMRRTSRYGGHRHGRHQDDEGDFLQNSFFQLKDVLYNLTELNEIEANAFLSPFLDVIRSEDTTGPITGLALNSINKFLTYGLVDPASDNSAAAIENIADAVTHARFVGTDPSSDEVILMKILYVLRTLLLCPAGTLLTNESVCEIMQSCFRICFEMKLSELLRKSAENTLRDMVHLLFTRLPYFKEDPKWITNINKKLKMRTGGVDPARIGKRKKSPKPKTKRSHGPSQQTTDTIQPTIMEAKETVDSATTEIISDSQSEFEHISTERLATTPGFGKEDTIIDVAKTFEAASKECTPEIESTVSVLVNEETAAEALRSNDQKESSDNSYSIVGHQSPNTLELSVDPSLLRKAQSETDLYSSEQNGEGEVCDDNESVHSTDTTLAQDSEFINPKGVRFLQNQQQQMIEAGPVTLIPYGLPCVRELFRFLVSLTNPLDRHNTDVMIHMGLSLLIVGLETAADHISSYNSLLYLVKDELSRNLSMLLQSERLSIFSASLRLSFLLFESMRSHLKLQLENYIVRVSELITSDSLKITYDHREIALDLIVQMWRIPGLVTELYLNYDCDLYCSNLFDDMTKLLSKNAFPVSGLYTIHLLSLDALLTVVDCIEQHCHTRTLAKTVAVSSDNPGSKKTTEGQIERPKSIRGKDAKKGPSIKPNRMMKLSSRIPTHEELIELKQKKKIYQTGTELFNNKPSKGLQYLQDQGLLSKPFSPAEIVIFLRENHSLDKKMIGEYISDKRNKQVLEAYVKAFNFEDTRVDEALRMYLESFRMPGEAPVISYLMEHFAEHWHKSNGEPFHNVDAAFTLTYAVIMLNVDQHNHNAKKQNVPMTSEDFKRNVSKVNGGEDFDQDMLQDIFQAIKNEEIVMPAEHSGLVKENYLWKVLLQRGTSKEGIFYHAPTGAFDHELFTLIWGPTVAALSFVFDKSSEETIIQKAVSGFRKCAMISAHYGMSDVFDNLVISLCKFTTLLSAVESPETIPASFGNNFKAQLAARTVFGLAQRHGDILREGWKNIMDCMLQLYRAKLLPKTMVEVEDFADSSGKICILREESAAMTRSETGVLSNIVSYFSLSESASTKGPSAEDLEAGKYAASCVRDCQLDHLILDSKFLREDSLQELIKSLVSIRQGTEDQGSMNGLYDEDACVFFLELLVCVVLQNRDRIAPVWQAVRDHFYNIIVNSNSHSFLVERAVVGLLRISIRLLRREEIAPQVLTSLRILLMMKPNVVHSLSRQISFGLHDLLKTNAANIHTSQDWYTLFTMLEVAGAGANLPPVLQVCPDLDLAEVISDAGAQSDSEVQSVNGASVESDRGYTSDSELYEAGQSRHPSQKQSANHSHPLGLELRPVPDNSSWMMVNRKDHQSSRMPVNQYSIDLNENLLFPDSRALIKSTETLTFLVRDAAHVTPHNFESCVHCIRTFVEAGVNGGRARTPPIRSGSVRDNKHNKKIVKRVNTKMGKSSSTPEQLHEGLQSDEDPDGEATQSSLQLMSIQLLDLMHTLHTRAAAIFSSWAQEEQVDACGTPAIKRSGLTRVNSQGIIVDAKAPTLWGKCWCPLLQGIARLCCDSRRQVRSLALTYLQRALLVHDLQTLSAIEWESCFNKVLFPLLTKLLENINSSDPNGMEETRMRASTLLCKVFLQHLSPLLSLSTFTALWLTILDFMEKYMSADRSDLLSEAIPESLKNMLLVMETAGIFQTADGTESMLWKLTWDKIDTFLPKLRTEVFKPFEPEPKLSKIERNDMTTEPQSVSPNVTSVSQQDQPTTAFPSQPQQHTPTENNPDFVPLEGITIVTHDDRPGSPLMNQPAPSAASAYILHPPLPNIPSQLELQNK